MEKDLKNVTQKMIGSTTDQKDDAAMNEGGTGSDSSTTDLKEISGGDDAAMNPEGVKMEEDHQKESGGDVALGDDVTVNEGGIGSDSSTTDQKGDDVTTNQGSAKMEENHQKESGEDDVALNEGGTGSDSSTSHQKDHLKNEAPKKMISSTTDNQKEGGGNTSDSSINITLRKRKSEGPSDTTISSKKRNGNPPGLHTMNLNAGQDVVDAIYQLSATYDHRQFVRIISATGSVSGIVFCDQYGSYKSMENSYMTSLPKLYLGGQDVHPCRKNARCAISFHDQYGNNFESVDMGRLIAAGPVEIIADTSKEIKTELKSVGGTNATAAPAPNANSGSGNQLVERQTQKSVGVSTVAAAPNVKSDLEKDVKELDASGKLVERQTSHLSPTTLPVSDGRLIPTTTSTANHEDLKSPSVEET